VGVSNFSADQMKRAAERLARYNIPLAANEVHYNLFHRAAETNGVLQACRELNVALVAYFPLISGRFKSLSEHNGSGQHSSGSKQHAILEVLQDVAVKRGVSLSQVMLNPGDVSLVPDPGYPVYSAGGIIAGARIVSLPLLAENGFLPDLKSIAPSDLERARILWLNYPNNPTGAVATMALYEEAIAFAREHDILIAHDAPYCDVTFDGYNAPSILQIPGAKDVVVEFNSLSKTYNMAGWRLGMAVGNAQVIDYLSTYKSQMDTSTFIPVFDAGVAALTADQGWLKERNEIYRERRDIVVNALRKAGFSLESPHAAIYVWAHLPQGQSDSMAFCSRMLEEIGVSATPGIVYGQYGEGFLRISLGQTTERIREAMDRIMAWKY